ncbi:50S ribosomal protein L19 [Candidatus Hepatoplasma crinochetorum]|jgi:large subunit ribosomal protein L19|uniref:Large ribosomal subunit protein bL19 n=1 Tax=Candidatus Hepatoplasma crinochetorum Av TaxID=1427984 RepID=W8GF82_9MOLU|nr:50S ribosomal protein L19 [Candidatus Hepatoplasma crinochetorum]AHK22268.1 50S ribosomal protein L19 [Candidatus Hepatoplasma crinochetorum Av]BDV02854.1 MAG: 50S ribosomal protein L19 [Candidatus Hepatoplasma crinochetorum]
MGANNNLINELTVKQLKTDIPNFKTGDTLRLHIKIKEGAKERIQIFEGFVLKKSKNNSIDSTFTVRKESYGIGVEKTFPINSPVLAKIEVIKNGKVRRAKIYYMRERKGKSARIKTIESKKK